MRNWIVVVSILMLLPGVARAGGVLLDIPVRDGVTQKVMLLEPDAPPRGVLVLYAGGAGTLGLGSFFGRPSIGDKSLSQNFLVRAREKFVDKGFAVALPDVPSDRKKLDYIYRLGEDQARDSVALVKALRSRYQAPVWLVGTSTGSLSAARGAIAAGQEIGGLVLTSSITRVPSQFAVYAAYPEGVISLDLPSLKAPALVLAHKDDQCDKTPAADASKIVARLSASPRATAVIVEGGDRPRSDACEALSAHGFLGIEDEVVAKIVDFAGG